MSSKSQPVMCLEILWHALMPCRLQSTRPCTQSVFHLCRSRNTRTSRSADLNDCWFTMIPRFE
jgi:hypothetical protein